MARKTTPSFVLELPLQTTAADDHSLAVRLDAARNIYNASLNEALRRLTLMRQSKAWRAARQLPKGPTRSKAFKAVYLGYEFTPAHIQKFAQQCRDGCLIGDHLGGHDMQTASLRALKVVEQYAFGKRGKPRLQRFGEFSSIEAKEAASTIIFRNGVVARAILDEDDWQFESLKAKTKYIRRNIHSHARWYVQLVREGYTPLRRAVRRGVVGLDIGPSNIAAVSADEAMFERFCPYVEPPWKELRRIERAMNRSRRATNPECFNPDGSWKKGAKARNRSLRYQRSALKRKERERRLAAERKRCHEEFANRILGQGTTVKTEKLSYRAWQRRYGKSTKVRGAGMFVGLLGNKLKAAGSELIEFGMRYTCLSQFNHTDGTLTKKPLKQRDHEFADGTRIGRDLYSAYLARFVCNERLDASQAAKTWSGMEAFLRAASDNFEPVSGRDFALPHVTIGVRAGRSKNPGQKVREAEDAVALVARATQSGVIRSNPGVT